MKRKNHKKLEKLIKATQEDKVGGSEKHKKRIRNLVNTLKRRHPK
jgi:hypothetical protein